jgi:F-type H+-transporting ATPase subunit b
MNALLTPAWGTVIWASIAFIVVLILLKKMAWGPILSALKEREESIAGALGEAEKARAEMASLSSENDRLLQEARNERDRVLREAREMADGMIAEAKGKAHTAAQRELEAVREAIQLERKSAIAGLKAEVAKLSVDIAERILREQLSTNENQMNLVNKLITESSFK